MFYFYNNVVTYTFVKKYVQYKFNFKASHNNIKMNNINQHDYKFSNNVSINIMD